MRGLGLVALLAVLGALGVLGVLAACHHAEAPQAAAPKGPTLCARASDSIVQAMLARLPPDATPPTEQADATRNLIRERCEHDGWSAEATQCLIAMTQLEDAEPCAKLMTEDQQAALVNDQEAQLGAGKVRKPEENGGSGDPRAGGQ